MESCRFWTGNKSNMAAKPHVAVTFTFCQVSNAVEALGKKHVLQKIDSGTMCHWQSTHAMQWAMLQFDVEGC
jgi:hypothetical protein